MERSRTPIALSKILMPEQVDTPLILQAYDELASRAATSAKDTSCAHS